MPRGNPPPETTTVMRLAEALGRPLSPLQAQVVAGYLDLLIHFRRRINLVGPSDWPTILRTLVADSWYLADFLASSQAAAVLPVGGAPFVTLDFGAGAGLPGIALRAFFDRGPYYLLEAREKRCVFLSEAVARLSLSGMQVAEGRVERTVPEILARHPGTFVLCLSRAFAPWPQFLEICQGLVRPPMAVVTMTGEAVSPNRTPAGFALVGSLSYAVEDKTRYLSLFACSAASM